MVLEKVEGRDVEIHSLKETSKVWVKSCQRKGGSGQ
jgi:hypothetical protein